MPHIQLTDAGRRDLEAQLLELQKERQSASVRLHAARDQGSDASENLDLRDAMEDLDQLEGRISKLTGLLASAEPLAISEHMGAQVGAAVAVRLQTGEEEDYTLVMSPEAAPRRGRLSVDSPIGRALVGARPGDEVVAETPGGRTVIQVLRVA